MGGHDPGLVYACITHVPLWLEPPSWITTIHLGEAQGPGRLNLRDLAPQWEPYHPVLGGTAGSFALRHHLLEHRPDATRVGICQYRKFVSRARISGVRDPKYRAMDVVPLDALAGEAYARHLDPGAQPFVVSAPRRFTRLPWYRRGYLKEYARDHHVEDLLRFTGEAVDQGVLERREVQAFFDEDVIVPGGVELGVYPAPASGSRASARSRTSSAPACSAIRPSARATRRGSGRSAPSGSAAGCCSSACAPTARPAGSRATGGALASQQPRSPMATRTGYHRRARSAFEACAERDLKIGAGQRYAAFSQCPFVRSMCIASPAFACSSATHWRASSRRSRLKRLRSSQLMPSLR